MRKFIATVLMVVCFGAALVFVPFGSVFRASAVSGMVTAFEAQNVLEDLQSSTVDGKRFDLLEYPYDNADTLQLLNFVEYCYGYNEALRADYGLYLYFYNPSNLDIDTANAGNKVQMGVSHDSDRVPNDFVKFPLIFLNKSTGDYAGLFYKFKIDIPNGFVNNLNSNGRRYDVSGIELATVGAANATDYKVGGTYIFSGYAAGYGPDATAASTLTLPVCIELETVELDVHYTNYRSNISSLGAGHQNQLNSVYFSVPNRFLNEYGRLQKIKAEWDEYKTKNIVVLKDEYYSEFSPYMGQYRNYDESKRGLYAGMVTLPKRVDYDWSYNRFIGRKQFLAEWTDYNTAYDEKYLPILLKSSELEVNNRALRDFISANNNYSGLFSSDIDAGRTRGYNLREFDADNVDDKWDLLSYDSNHSKFQAWLDYGFFASTVTGGDFFGVDPIYKVKASDILKGANELFVNEQDFDSFSQFFGVESLKKSSVFLFRFALTDYFSQLVSVGGNPGGTGGIAGFRAIDTVFLDFDIISLTFSREGKERVIPVVSSPINIINNPTEPLFPDVLDWWEKVKEKSSALLRMILMVVVAVLLFVILWPVLPYIIKAIVWVVVLPFKLIGALFRAIGKSAKKRKE